ncbi:MAG TPA: heme exporter protein CcmD [Burkholderiaceae bacterium]|nr:heme exporter protein CcmD [Burkholderiaceae bacterium]
MSYANLSEFINMGGYGAYVWSSFGLCAFAMLMECLTLRSQRRSAIARLHEEMQHADQYEALNERPQS